MPLESYTQADILLTERRRLETPLLLLIWMGCVGFSLAEANFFYLVSSTLAVGVNFFAARRHKVVYIHRLFVNIGVIVASLIVLAELIISNQNIIMTLGHYMVLIQLCKLFEKKRSRDYIQLLALNLLLLMCTALLTANPWFAIWAVVYLILACYVAIVFTLKRGLDLAAKVKLHGELGPLSPRRVAWNVSRYWPSKTIRRVMLLIIIPSFLMGAGVFLLAPRTTDRLGLFNKPFGEEFEPNIKLGRSREVYLSDRIAMKLKIIRQGQAGPAKSESSRYLRRHVLNKYSDSSWTTLRYPDKVKEFVPVKIDENLQDKLVTHEINLLRIGQPDVLAPDTTVEISSPDHEFRVSAFGEFSLSGTFRPIQSIKYKTESFPTPLNKEELAFLKKLDHNEKVSTRPSLSVEIPLGSRLLILNQARQWCGDLLAERQKHPEKKDELNLAIAQRVAQVLRQEYEYTLDLTDADPNRDGVEDFLFYLKKGHCEYFASTMAVMCNLLEVPTQVGTGFLLEEYNRETKEYIVRERDAHAWCEVYSPETGWKIIDPTSGSGRAEMVKREWWTFISDYIEDLRFMWYEKIVGYDFDSQKTLSEKASGEAKAFLTKSRNYLSSLVKSLKKSVNNLIIHGEIDIILVKFLVVLVIISILVFVLLLLRLRTQKQTPEQIEMLKRLKLLYRFMALLRRKGLAEHPELTLREKLYFASVQFNLPWEPLKEMARLQYQWRWGEKEPTAADFQMVRHCFSVLCKALDESNASDKSTRHKRKKL